MSSTIFFFLFIPLLAFILLGINLIFAPHNPYMEKNSAFECGFSSFLGQNRTQFSISFFIFALLFLLFDLEILLVYPYLTSAYTNGIYGLTILLLFLLALTLGFAFELGKKALSIDSRQMSNVSSSKSNSISKVSGNINLSSNSGFLGIKVGISKVQLTRTFNSLAWVFNSPPKPHALVGLPAQSSRYNKTLTWLIPIFVSFGLCLAYKYPIHFMLSELNLSYLYVYLSILISIGSYWIITNLLERKISFLTIGYIVVSVSSVYLILLWCSAHHGDIEKHITTLACFLPSLVSTLTQILDAKATMGCPAPSTLRPTQVYAMEGSSGTGSRATGNTGSGSGTNRVIGRRWIAELSATYHDEPDTDFAAAGRWLEEKKQELADRSPQSAPTLSSLGIKDAPPGVQYRITDFLTEDGANHQRFVNHEFLRSLHRTDGGGLIWHRQSVSDRLIAALKARPYYR